MSTKPNREHKTNGLAKGPVYFHAPPIKTAFAVRPTEDYSLQYPKDFLHGVVLSLWEDRCGAIRNRKRRIPRNRS
jgi:hypothetical protein